MKDRQHSKVSLIMWGFFSVNLMLDQSISLEPVQDYTSHKFESFRNESAHIRFTVF